MSTATQTPRTPHALQTGGVPGTLWVVGALASLAVPALALVCAYGFGWAVEDTAISWWLVVGVAALALFSFGNRLAMNAASLRVPGGMRCYSVGELAQIPTIVPTAALSAAHGFVTLVVGAWVLGHGAPEDYGITIGLVTVMAILIAVADVRRVAADMISLVYSWKGALAIGLPEAVAAIVLIVMSLGMDREASLVGLAIGCCLALVVVAFRMIGRSASGAGGMTEELDAVSEDVLKRRNAAPTLDERQKARLWGRWIAGVILGGVVFLVVFWSLLQ